MTIILGDCLEKLKELPDNSVDSTVTDPPYELGFMGKSWDNTGIANNVDMWREVLRVLKPGGHLLSFGGTRTYHRMACAIEDAGFEIRDQIGWAYGSGFPKSLDVSKAIDKAAGAEREVVAVGSDGAKRKPRAMAPGGAEREAVQTLSEPSTPEAKQWSGWGTALKPAWEPIVVARKPLSEGTVAANVLKWGTGALNIDSCRVGTTKDVPGTPNSKGETSGFNKGWGDHNDSMSGKNPSIGRWPANLIHDGSDEVVGMFPNTGVARSRTKRPDRSFAPGTDEQRGEEGLERDEVYNDQGNTSAARFFYCAKASKKDRDEGLEGFEVPEEQLSGLDTRGRTLEREDGTKTLVERWKPNPRANNHPTVKPTELMRYLCRLVTPPGGTVLDPFTGSGSTGKAAKMEGFSFIGIEKEEEYVRIAEARIKAVPDTLL